VDGAQDDVGVLNAQLPRREGYPFLSICSSVWKESTKSGCGHSLAVLEGYVKSI